MSFYTKKYILHDKNYILKTVFFDKYFNKDWKILDVGCSVGNFIAYNPNNIIGLEKDKDALKIAKNRGFKVYECDIEKDNLKFLKEKFDAINLRGVLEHLDNPDKIILKLKGVLKEKGIFVITVPALPYISLEEFYWDYTHKTVYTKESLVGLAQNNNLKILRIEPENKYYLKGINRIHKLISRYMLNILLKILGKGNALIAVMRKQEA
jgi:SAM-dependent methyltransferase